MKCYTILLFLYLIDQINILNLIIALMLPFTICYF